jgi:hypothetical protein
MTQVKARYRMAKSLGEAMKLINAKNPSIMRNFRGKKKLWEEGEYEKADDHAQYPWKRKRGAKPVSLAPVKWMEDKE